MRGPPNQKLPSRGGKGSMSEFGAAWAKLFHYMDRYKYAFLVALIFAAASTVLTIIGPDYLSEITDIISSVITTNDPLDMDSIWGLVTFLAVIYVVSWVLNYVQSYLMATVSQRVASNLRTDISRKINRLPLRFFDTSSTGDVLSRVTNDVDTIGQSLNQSIGTLVSSITLLVGSLVMMLITNVWLTIAAVLSTLIGFILVMVIMSRSQKYFNRQQVELGRMNGHVEEIYSGHITVKAYNGEKEAKEKFSEINEALRSSAFKSQFMGGVMGPLMTFIGNLGYVVVCIYGAVLCVEGSISFGTIIAFILYVRYFTQPLTQMSQAIVYMQTIAAASKRVFAFLEEPEMEDESEKDVVLDHVEGHVEFRDVHFGYLPGKEIIHGFSAEVLPGQKVAIVGPTGAGKTTMVNLLMRFYDVDSGDILIDGVSTKDMKRETVHDMFCMVLQDTWLFDGTLRENLVYSKEGVTDEDLDRVCAAVGLKHYVDTLPERYDTHITDMTEMSAGQRQQVTIARAMISNEPLLILDEATSSVDTKTEKVIQDAMDSLTEGRTSFVIAHRLSTIRNSNLILVMKDGNIIEQGTHDELMAQGGFYADLYNSQFVEGPAVPE